MVEDDPVASVSLLIELDIDEIVDLGVSCQAEDGKVFAEQLTVARTAEYTLDLTLGMLDAQSRSLDSQVFTFEELGVVEKSAGWPLGKSENTSPKLTYVFMPRASQSEAASSSDEPLDAAPRAGVLQAIDVVAVPNPFNPKTTITCELTVRAEVRVDIYDVRGRPISGADANCGCSQSRPLPIWITVRIKEEPKRYPPPYSQTETHPTKCRVIA